MVPTHGPLSLLLALSLDDCDGALFGAVAALLPRLIAPLIPAVIFGRTRAPRLHLRRFV